MSNKIIVRLFGGLGNQLFIYAAARRLALISNSELVLDDVTGFARDIAYQRNYQLKHFNINSRKATRHEQLHPFSRIRRLFIRNWNSLKPFELRKYLCQEGVDYDSRLLNYRPYGNVYLEGYWQSEKYFIDIECVIRQDLEIKPPTDAKNMEMARMISSTLAVAVHVRFFDEPESPGDNNTPKNYYGRAIAKMESIEPGAHYYIFSDKPEFARAKIPLPNNRITMVTHNKGDQNAYADLWLMTKCRHFIIANSTFSWWGAWLSKSVEKKIIAPSIKIESKDRVTSWGFNGLLPEKWILL